MESPLLLESILVEKGQIPLLEGHAQRVYNTALAYDLSVSGAKQAAIAFKDAVATCVASDSYEKKTKCRVMYSLSSDNELLPLQIHEITMAAYHMREIRSLQVIEASELDYHHKFADRTDLNRLVSAKSVDFDDILITQNGLVTDTSYCNVVFERDGHYITPAKPLLPGVRRRMLIESGKVEETDIPIESIGHFDAVHLINAMIGLSELTLSLENIR